MKNEMTMKNYHNESTVFTVGQTVTHVTDEGEMCKGVVTEVKGDLLHISFADGEEGWEKTESCF